MTNEWNNYSARCWAISAQLSTVMDVYRSRVDLPGERPWRPWTGQLTETRPGPVVQPWSWWRRRRYQSRPRRGGLDWRWRSTEESPGSRYGWSRCAVTDHPHSLDTKNITHFKYITTNDRSLQIRNILCWHDARWRHRHSEKTTKLKLI